MKLRYLLMRYGEEIERNKKEYKNEIEDSKQNGIEGFIDKDFKIPNYIYESLSFLLQIKGVELLYFNNPERCNIAHLKGSNSARRKVVIRKSSNISKEIIDEMCLRYEDTYNKNREAYQKKKTSNNIMNIVAAETNISSSSVSFNSPAPVVMISPSDTANNTSNLSSMTYKSSTSSYQKMSDLLLEEKNKNNKLREENDQLLKKQRLDESYIKVDYKHYKTFPIEMDLKIKRCN